MTLEDFVGTRFYDHCIDEAFTVLGVEEAEDEEVSYFTREYRDEPVCTDCIVEKGLREE